MVQLETRNGAHWFFAGLTSVRGPLHSQVSFLFRWIAEAADSTDPHRMLIILGGRHVFNEVTFVQPHDVWWMLHPHLLFLWYVVQQLAYEFFGELILRFWCSDPLLVENVALHLCKVNEVHSHPLPPFHSFSVEAIISKILVKAVDAIHMFVVVQDDFWLHGT